VRKLGEERRRMDRCNELCTKEVAGYCALCNVLAERDRFERFWFKGGVFIDGLYALKQWRQSTNQEASPLVLSGGVEPASMPQQGLWERTERVRGAADETARLTQTFYLSFLLLGTYIAIIIGSTTDMQLLKVSPVTLPLLNVQLPIVEFYVIVPWLLLLVYFNVLLHLTFLADKLHQFTTVLTALTDAAAREEQRLRVFPFPFSALLIGRPARGSLRLLLGLMVVMTVVFLPLILLLWAQLRFLPYHGTAITWNHRAAVLADLVLLWLFWPLLLPPVQRPASAAPSRGLWRVVPLTASATHFRWGTGLVCLTLVTVGVALAPFSCNLQLQEQILVAGEPAAEVVAALRSMDDTKRAQGLEKITGLILTQRDLRGANLRNTLFPKADLRGANLEGADLSDARVFAGNLAPLKIAQCSFCPTNLQRSILGRAQLQGADLTFAQLQGAHLGGADLQGAILWGAQLQGATLGYAQFQGATLGLADLQGATLYHADLQGVNLEGAQLQGANLEGAQLRGANLEGADLQGAYLEGADIGSANFSDANLTWSTLRGLSQSPLDKETYERLENLRDPRARAASLKRLQDAVGRPTNLSAAHARERSVLCDHVTVFPSCITPEQSAEYAEGRARFLVGLGCKSKDAAIARGITIWYLKWLEPAEQKDPILMVFAKRVTASLEKDCPGWAALSADEKDSLRTIAAEENTVPK
jgi:uncharacterized protein YjbI with pentapeptide repeats